MSCKCTFFSVSSKIGQTLAVSVKLSSPLERTLYDLIIPIKSPYRDDPGSHSNAQALFRKPPWSTSRAAAMPPSAAAMRARACGCRSALHQSHQMAVSLNWGILFVVVFLMRALLFGVY